MNDIIVRGIVWPLQKLKHSINRSTCSKYLCDTDIPDLPYPLFVPASSGKGSTRYEQGISEVIYGVPHLVNAPRSLIDSLLKDQVTTKVNGKKSNKITRSLQRFISGFSKPVNHINNKLFPRIEKISYAVPSTCEFWRNANANQRDTSDNRRNTGVVGRYTTRNWPNTRKIGRNAARYLVISKILFCVCLAHAGQRGLGTPAAASVALPTDSIKPLQIGDTIPETLWNLPLKMVKAGQEGSTIVTLDDYKGKLIILDFWATWCVSCIKYMPHMHSVADTVKADVVLLPSTSENIDVVQNFMRKTASPQMQALKSHFSSLISSTTINHYFPRTTIPHVVIIGRDGVVEAITLPAYITADNLKLLSKKAEVNFVRKTEGVDEPLLQLRLDNNMSKKAAFYSALIPYQEGLLFPTGFRRDSLNNCSHMYYVNASILKLYAFALQHKKMAGTGGIAYMPSRRILAVRNPEKFEFKEDRNPNYDHQNMRFTYEAVMPIHRSKERAQKKMKAELDEYLDMEANYEWRSMPCLILRVINKNDLPITKSEEAKIVLNGIWQKKVPEKVASSANGANSYLQHYQLSQLVYLLNNQNAGAIPFVIDETGIDEALDLDLPETLADVDQLNTTLRRQGLILSEENRNIPMFILKENGFSTSGEPTLGKFGYVYEYTGKEGGVR